MNTARKGFFRQPTEHAKVKGKRGFYSSTMVRDLMENDIYTFWSKDWKKKLIVQWDCRVPLSQFSKKVQSKLGSGFGYELRVAAILGNDGKPDMVIKYKRKIKSKR